MNRVTMVTRLIQIVRIFSYGLHWHLDEFSVTEIPAWWKQTWLVWPFTFKRTNGWCAQFQWQNQAVEREMSEVLEMCQHVLSLRHEYNITKTYLPGNPSSFSSGAFRIVIFVWSKTHKTLKECFLIRWNRAKWFLPASFPSSSLHPPPLSFFSFFDAFYLLRHTPCVTPFSFSCLGSLMPFSSHQPPSIKRTQDELV